MTVRLVRDKLAAIQPSTQRKRERGGGDQWDALLFTVAVHLINKRCSTDLNYKETVQGGKISWLLIVVQALPLLTKSTFLTECQGRLQVSGPQRLTIRATPEKAQRRSNPMRAKYRSVGRVHRPSRASVRGRLGKRSGSAVDSNQMRYEISHK